MLRIESWLETYLVGQPEYRMGYQKVVATLNTGGREEGIIINSTVFLKTAEMPSRIEMNWDEVVAETKKSDLIVTNVRLIPREAESLRGVRAVALANEKFKLLSNRKLLSANSAFGSQKSALHTEAIELGIKAANAAAENAPITLTTAGEIFKRFSAFRNDRRVTANMGLTAGTFATTKDDADANIKTGSDAVARYALPNPTPASNVFTITTAQDLELQRGTTQPANNQPGGGVEVIFVNGSPPNTVTGPASIPDK